MTEEAESGPKGWTVKRITPRMSPIAIGTSVFSDGWAIYDPNEALRSFIEKKAARRFILWRMRRRLSGALEVGGCDSFHDLPSAQDFATNRPGIWGL